MSGKIVLLKDISNIASQAKEGKSCNDLTAVVKDLIAQYGIAILNGSIFSVVLGAQVAVLVDDNNALCGLFFQDQSVIDTFKSYPEIIFVDATYKLLELSLPVFLILCEDSNGCSEVVGVCLLVCEDLESMKWIMETFKQHNPRSSDI